MTAMNTGPRAITPAAIPGALPQPTPTEIIDVVDQRIFELQALLRVIDQNLFSEICERANVSGDRRFVEEADTLCSLMTVAMRDLESTKNVLGEHYLMLTGRSDEKQPLARFVVMQGMARH